MTHSKYWCQFAIIFTYKNEGETIETKMENNYLRKLSSITFQEVKSIYN
jgi:hypothetical protein